ncbi:MAG TPA: carboxyl transferase domain-containing protein, partial [Actinomycetota bacterium]|nr:carboxyl transferase domain-containing protein [Actinomycetota bacterium]
VMGAEGAVNIIHRKEIAGADDADAKRAELIADYSERFSTPYIAAERGYVDAVIEPQETRKKLVQSLEMLRSKRETIPQRKHGNIPL